LSKIWFVSSNEHKYGEARRILARMGMGISHHRASLPEVQSHSLEEIALAKAASARSLVGGAVLVEDDGLFIDSLKGFPGPYSSYVFDTIGNAGILSLVRGDRTASFRSVVAYADDSRTAAFKGEVRGRIADAIRGSGWGYDPVFIPDGAGGTFAQIDKDQLSHRGEALAAFARWYGDGRPPLDASPA